MISGGTKREMEEKSNWENRACACVRVVFLPGCSLKNPPLPEPLESLAEILQTLSRVVSAHLSPPTLSLP